MRTITFGTYGAKRLEGGFPCPSWIPAGRCAYPSGQVPVDSMRRTGGTGVEGQCGGTVCRDGVEGQEVCEWRRWAEERERREGQSATNKPNSKKIDL